MRTRTFHAFAFAALSALALAACSKSTAHFHVVRAISVALDSTAVAQTFSGKPAAAAGIEPECTQFRTTLDRIESARAKTVKLVLADSNQTFGFAKSARVYLSGGPAETEIASLDSIPADAGNVLYLETSGQDLRLHLTGSKLQLRLTLDSDEALTQNTDVKVQCTFFVSAKQKRKKKK